MGSDFETEIREQPLARPCPSMPFPCPCFPHNHAAYGREEREWKLTLGMDSSCAGSEGTPVHVIEGARSDLG